MIRYNLTDLVIVPTSEIWDDARPLTVDREFFAQHTEYREGTVVLCPYGDGKYLMEVDPITRESTGRRQQFRLVADGSGD